MGWNESEVILLPAGWRISIEESPKGRTADGTPVQFLCLERVEDGRAKRVNAGGIQTWLEERGFELRERSPSLSQFALEEVDVFLCMKEGELAEVSVRFTLTRTSPNRWASWEALVGQLCQAWGLELYDPDRGLKVDAGEILRVLAGTQAWKDFEANFNWPPVTSAYY